jgi:redox-sensing transcriptional repressor
LADAIGVTASQVRKDFSIFGISGNKRGGYKIEELIEKINNILGKNELNKVIIVGAGKLGMALLKYKGFEKEGIKIVASFDIDSTKYVGDSDVPVLPLEELNDFVRKNNIRIGIIAVPDMAAQSVADSMFLAGIRGILNFAPIRLKSPEDRVLNNVNLEVELENLIYFVNVLDKTREHK